ncbi:two-component regulator propeller domain-containing protein [Stenotrophomonas sp. TWI700]|uniref:hybrid sensor histidine kinase/response regulator n=1 Tax=Stenotrophomonas sp. TWI700 TaxID=3136792 RepID=UPI003209FF4E
MKHGLRRRWVGVLLCGLLPAVSALALPSHGARVTTVDGLPSNVVHQIVEDRQGYLWFATGDGLARYDGSGFRVWRMEHGLADNEVRSMALDARDQLWIGTANGYLQRLSADRQQFERWAGPRASAAATSPVLAILPMDEGSVWFGTRDAGLFRLGPDRRLRQYLPGAGGGGLPSARVNHLAADPQGGVWIGSAAGLARWHDDRFQTPAMLGASLLPVTALGRDAQGAMRVSTADGTEVRYPPSLQPAPRPREPARWLGPSRAGGDWFADGGQLWWQDRHGQDRHAITLPHLHGRSMPRIVRVVEDRQGRVWLLGSHQGVWRLGAQWRHLERFTAPGDPPAAASGGLAAATDGQAWWARGGWLGKVSPVHGFSRARWSYTQNPLRPDRHAVVEDAQGRVWVFAAPWLTRIDPARGVRRRWRVGADDAGPATSTQAALLACDGGVWLAGNGRLQRRAEDGQVLLERTYEAVRLRPGGTPFVLQCDPAGQLWLGDSDGLKQWQPGHARFDLVPGGPRRAVGALHLAADGQLWAADPDGWTAFRRASARLHRSTRIDATQGLPGVLPRGLADAVDGALWATTARGVVRLAPDRRSARLYTVDDGLPPMVFDLGLVAVGGHLLAMDLAGDVLALDPAGMTATTDPPLLVIDRVQVRRQRRWIELPVGDPLRLNADDRDIQLSARLLSGGQRGVTDYRFRLRGQDPAWVRAGQRGTRGFPRLPAGAHVLEFQARGVDGEWTPLQQVRLQVDHNGWAHPGAWALFCLVAMGGAVLLAGAVRRHQARANARRAATRRQARAERAAQAKEQYLATLGHEVRTPLTAVLGMSELLLAGPLSAHARKQVLHIEQGGRALLQVVDEALENARLQAGKVRLQPRRFAIGPWRMDMEAALAACLDLHGCRLSLGPPLPAGACRTGDPDRLRQAVHLLARELALQVGAPRVTLRMAWLPGGTGLLLDIIAVPGALPSPALEAVRERLADVDVLAAAMQGQLRVLQLPDHRWQAVLSLPLAGCGTQLPDPQVTVADHDGLQVLLVEDDPLVAEVVTGLLRMRGHAVVAAGHALAALTALARPGTQLMLLDLDLPGMDGLSLLRLLRQRDQRLPVLILTARRDPDLEATVTAAGADGLLHKPLQGDALHAAMQRIMARNVDRAGPGNGLLCGALPDDRGGRG